MRTTLTIDDDVSRKLKAEERRTGLSFKEVVNAALRRGLQGTKPPGRPKRFVVTPKACGFRTGIDLLKLNQLSDELEIEAFRSARS